MREKLDIKIGDTYICISSTEGYMYGNMYSIKDISYHHIKKTYYVWIFESGESCEKGTSGTSGFPLRKEGSPLTHLGVTVAYFDLYFESLKEIRRKKLEKICE